MQQKVKLDLHFQDDFWEPDLGQLLLLQGSRIKSRIQSKL